MEIDKFLLGLVLFLVVILTGQLLVSDINSNYDGIMVESINDTLFADISSQNAAVRGQGTDYQDTLQLQAIDEADTEMSLYKAGWSALLLVKNIPGIINSLMLGIAGMLGVPLEYIYFAYTGLLIALAFGIVYLIFRVAKG